MLRRQAPFKWIIAVLTRVIVACCAMQSSEVAAQLLARLR